MVNDVGGRVSLVAVGALVEPASEVLFRASADWGETETLHGSGSLADGATASRAWLARHVPEDELPQVTAAIDAGIRAGRPFELEHRIRRADGTTAWMRTCAAPVRDASGAIAHWFGTASDVTCRRQCAAAALTEVNTALRDAERRKNEFLGMLSHELRNPLAAMRAALLLLDREPADSGAAQRALAVLSRQARQVTRLVDDLLDVTRISRGKIRLQLAPVELGALALRTAEDQRQLFLDAGIALDVRVDPAPLWLTGDAVRLVQAIGNLLQNAAKFTPRGGRASLSVERDVGGGAAVVRVADTGCGLSAQALRRIFEPFMQADDTLSRSQGGLGLGLAVVKGLVELHGGAVEAASAGPGLGASFTLTLPLGPVEPRAAAMPEAHAPHGPRRVLLIDDNRDAVDMLSEVLVFDGHLVDAAHTGPEGIDKVRSFAPEVVFCDIGLPGMDGYQVARALRDEPSRGRFKLVALTGYAGPEDVARAIDAGFDAHLGKPPSLEALAHALS